MKLRDYQEESINNIRKAFKEGHQKVCFQLPTGAGKTILAAFMIKNAVAKGLKVLFLVHLKELVRQTSDKLSAVGIEHSFITTDGDFVEHRSVQIAMVQTLVRRLAKINWEPDLIITDECQHVSSNTYNLIYERFPKAKQVGLTATPQRLDGKGLNAVYDTLVKGPKVKALIDRGFLAGYKLFGVPSDLDLSDVHSLGGDYKLDELEEAISRSSIIGDAVKHYKNLLAGRKAIGFCSTVRHSRLTAQRFVDAGIPAAHLDGTMKTMQRDEIIQQFRDGKILVLFNCSLVSEGFDVPDCDGIIMLRPTQSLPLYLQAIGRALRPQENKTAIVLDHVGNYLRHGLPDDDRDWTLEGRKKKKKGEKINVKTCESCFAVYSSRLKLCPHCNAAAAKQTREEIEEVEGELHEIKRGPLREERKGAQTLEQLIALGKARGYKPGWAKYVYEARLRKKNG